MAGDRRLADELISRRLAGTEEESVLLIKEGRVIVDGAPALNPDRRVSADTHVSISEARPYVSRGGDKLKAALTDLAVSVAGKKCLDAGAGSGGFTDVLLKEGAASVLAVDVGYGQFDWSLRNDPRVELLERTNIRKADPMDLGGPFDLVIADLSFISLTAVISVLTQVASADGHLLLLVKPQFEAPREEIPPGGVVGDPSVWSAAIRSVCDSLIDNGWSPRGVVPSRLPGARGNREFFVLASKGPGLDPKEMIALAVAEAS